MKQYVIDQLREGDFLKLADYLEKNTDASELPGIYWVTIPEELYATEQQEHIDCRPFYFAVNLDMNSIRFELLIRTRTRLRCGCIQYANEEQRNYILNYADEIFAKLNLMS